MNMKKSKKIYVIYHPGSYGSWVRWLIEYCNDIGHRHKTIPRQPIAADGSSHSMATLPNAHPAYIDGILDTLKEKVNELCGYKIYRACPAMAPPASDVILQGLVDYKDEEDKVIYIDVDNHTCEMHCLINIDLKTTWHESAFDLHQKAKHWVDNSNNFFQLERWQQREMISLSCFEMIKSLTKTPVIKSDEILVVKMSEIMHDDTVELAKKLINHCGLPLRQNFENTVIKAKKMMIDRQRSYSVYESIIKVIDAVIAKDNVEIPPMPLFAESIIQRMLRDKGLELSCHGLNVFPKTTADLSERIIW